jgi:mycothiol synthase
MPEGRLTQLQMIWPYERLDQPPEARTPPGYLLRTYQPGDEAPFCRLMAMAGFEGWDEQLLRPWLGRVVPGGWFFVVEEKSGEMAVTAMTTHNASEEHPFGGELGWVAGNPAHAGRGLGLTVCAAVTVRFLAAGYFNIYLKTDDWRLPALRTYLKLGYLPFLFQPDMEGRWKAVCSQLQWPFTPEQWPTRQERRA